MHFEDYSPRWQDGVCALSDRTFGKGYIVNPSEIAQEPDSCLYVCISSNEEVIGLVYGRVLPQYGLEEFLEHRVEEIPEDLKAADADGTLGVIQTVAVAPDHRGKGIGTKLLRAVHDGIVGQGADKLIVTFKRGPIEADVKGIMNELGFEQWTKLQTYFQERCEQGAFDCIHRKNGCSCEAVLYRKVIFSDSKSDGL